MRIKEIRKIVSFIGIGIIKKGRGISQGKQIQITNPSRHGTGRETQDSKRNNSTFEHLNLEIRYCLEFRNSELRFIPTPKFLVLGFSGAILQEVQ